MATNRAYAEGNQISLPVPDGTESGDPVCVGALNAVALVDQQDDDEATCQLDGAFYFPLDGPVDAGDVVTGADIGASEINGGDDSKTFGVALRSVANGETDVLTPVRLSN